MANSRLVTSLTDRHVQPTINQRNLSVVLSITTEVLHIFMYDTKLHNLITDICHVIIDIYDYN